MTKITRKPATSLSRRRFIVSSAAAGGGLALGFQLPFGIEPAAAQKRAAAPVEVNAWVVVKPDDTCVIRIARSEMGQGTLTGLAQLVTEELECDWNKVADRVSDAGRKPRAQARLGRVRHRRQPRHPHFRGLRAPRRRGRARACCCRRLPNEWKVPVERAHRRQRRHHAHAERAARRATARWPPPPRSSRRPIRRASQLKDPRTWKVAGKPMKRLDTAPKLNGSLVYAIDVKLPGMLCAAIKDCPVFGGKLVSFDNAKIAAMPGVKRAVRVNDTTVAVVADTWWHAKKALDALPIVWDEGENATRTSAQIAAHLKEGLTAANAYAMRNDGDALKAIAGGAEQGRGRLQHAVPRARDDGADELHGASSPPTAPRRGSPTQNGEASLAALSEQSGPAARQVRGLQAHPRRRLRPARRRAGLRAAGGADRQAVPRRPGQDDLEPRRGHDARFLPADLAVPDGGGHRRRGQSRRRCTCACRASRSTRSTTRRPPRTARTTASCRATTRSRRRRAVRLHGAQPADRVRDAQHARAGRSVARRQHQPERRLRRMLHGRGGARGGQGSARVPARADGQASEAPRRAQRGGGEGRLGHAAAGGRASRHRAVHGLRQLLGGGGRGVGGQGRQGQGAPDGAGTELRPRGQSRTRSPRRSKARSPTACRRRSTAS